MDPTVGHTRLPSSGPVGDRSLDIIEAAASPDISYPLGWEAEQPLQGPYGRLARSLTVCAVRDDGLAGQWLDMVEAAANIAA